MMRGGKGMEKRNSVDLVKRDVLKKAGIVSGILTLETLVRCETKKPVEQKEEIKYPGEKVGSRITYHDKYPIEYSEEFIPSTCWIGKQDCSLVYRVLTQKINGHHEIKRPVSVVGLYNEAENIYNPRNKWGLCPKGVSANISAIYDYNRVKYPLMRINRKGEKGKFVRISWDEAKKIISEKLLEVKSKGQYVLWQKGRSKSAELYDNAFVNSLKGNGWNVYKIGHGSHCSDSGYRACELTVGEHAVLNPDYKYTEYVIDVGTGSFTKSGGNKLCFIYWPQVYQEARESGRLKKVVGLNPSRYASGYKIDEWIPIKPGTDLAFFLGVAHYLLSYDLIDKSYLKKYTNAPFLVIQKKGDKEGYFIRNKDGKELVWDKAQGKFVPYDIAQDPELFFEGDLDPATLDSSLLPLKVRKQVGSSNADYKVGLVDFNETVKVKSVLKIFKDTLIDNGWTPEWADKVCDIPSLTTARIARELYKYSGIAEDRKIQIDGIEYPLRPVSFQLYHLSQVELGFQLTRAILIVSLLLGAYGVPGGTMVDFAPGKFHNNFKSLDEGVVKDPPYDYTLSSSKFFPITTPNPSFLSRVLVAPEKYQVDPKKLPKFAFVHMNNVAVSYVDIPQIIRGWQNIDFVVVLSPWIDETASLFADIVLPIATADKYEGPISGKTPYETADTLRIPPIESLWESKSEISAYMEICEALGILYGDKGYIANINKELNLGANSLDVNKKPRDEEIFDSWAKSKGKDLNYFREKGLTPVSQISSQKTYSINLWKTDRMRIYAEALKRYQDEMKKRGVDKIYWQDYTPLPMWRNPTMEASVGYNFYLISIKKIEGKQSRTAFIPVLSEIIGEQKVIINEDTARSMGIQNDDWVYVESHNALTGETRRIKVKVETSRTIRPDTVAMFHHFGMWADPRSREKGPTPNELYFGQEGYIQCTQDASFHVKVKIYKA